MKNSTLGKLSAIAIALFTTVSFARADQVEYISPSQSNLPFSDMVITGSTVYLSGKIGLLPGTRELAPGGIEAETRQTMENLEASLERNGMTMSNLVKCTAILTDIAEWPGFNSVYTEYFEDGKFPARAAFAASGLAFGARVEVDCIAHKG